VLCHGTFLLSDSTVCCAKYNGNTILLKHASMVHSAVSQWKNCLKKQAPEGLYTNLLISRSTALVSDERIKGVSLTGSEAAGSSMAEAAGKYLKKSVLELGGSDAL
jgi:succinate-semialdehyde dehydrogenase/glutarate-semialdehyde dehydrogenase